VNHQQLLSTYQQNLNSNNVNDSMPTLLPVPLIHVRIINYNSTIKIKQLRAKFYGMLKNMQIEYADNFVNFR
jgi:hypothetical protein